MKYQPKHAGEIPQEQLALYLSNGFGEKFAQLLYIRNIRTQEEIDNYFNFSVEQLHDPFLLKGMQAAVERINRAIKNREKILIIGDYDCDGICSVAILYQYLLKRRVHTRYYLPHREADGYGMSIDLLDKLIPRFKPNLIITVDCGISCQKEVEHIKAKGIDCIVTDHHAIPECCPECISINPKFTDQEYPFDGLAGAGVSLKLVQALAQEQTGTREGGLKEAESFFDICALATVADIVPLRDENRVIVKLGLDMLNANSRPSISELSKSCNVFGRIRASDISYKIGPKINASGRMGNAKRGLDIILEKDPKEIEKIIQSLGDYNVKRQKLCQRIYEESDKIIEEQKLDQNDIIIVHKDDWDGGVLGIVAARLSETFNKPSMVFGKVDNLYRGSARSVPGINMVDLIKKFEHLVNAYGGHSMAAGLSIPVENFNEFVEKVTKAVTEQIKFEGTVEEKFYDFDLQQSDINQKLVIEFEKLEPTGCENPVPLFQMTIGAANAHQLPAFPDHVRFIPVAKPTSHSPWSAGAQQFLSFIFFNAKEYLQIIESPLEKQIIFEFQKLDYHGNNPSTQIKAVAKELIFNPTCETGRALQLGSWLMGSKSMEVDTEIIKKLSTDREVFGKYFNALRLATVQKVTNMLDLFNQIKVLSPNEEFNIHQFIFCATVFKELGILYIKNQRISVNDKISTKLEKSQAYKKVKE